MDIFEEIKEAVMIATPGEDTRNYYRNQGVELERNRIIDLLESKLVLLQAVESGHNAGSEINAIRTKTIEAIIEFIKAGN